MKKFLLSVLFLIACDHPADELAFRVGECPGDETGDPPPPPPPTTSLPTPTAPCPTITNGTVEFCPGPLLTCRQAVFRNVNTATGSGPLVTHWHGTGETPEDVLSWDWAIGQLVNMTAAQGGVLVLPRADPAAVARSGNPFPWWVACGDVNPAQCNRPDDFVLADEIIACALEQELISPERITVSGLSAGGVMASHLVDRTSNVYAGAVSFSGGLPVDYQPTTPGIGVAVMALHGGPTDVYCGAGVSSCVSFQENTEALALDVSNAGRFAFVCDHQAGHSAAMGPEAASFLAAANIQGHAWAGYPFGYPGTGFSWMLNHYCYAPGTTSPWE